jgi:hypothetical protein
MITDTEIRRRGTHALIEALGDVEAERYLAIVSREPFDYTKWQKDLWPERSIEDISDAAARLRQEGTSPRTTR